MEPDRRRRTSREAVIAVLREHGPLPRAEIAARAELSRATVSSVVAELQRAGLVREGMTGQPGSRGRRPGLVRLHRSAGAAVGIDFDKRHLRVAAADLGHQLLAERVVELEPDHAAAEGIELAARLLDEVLAEARLDRDLVVAVGMGLPGPVTRASGRLGSSTILPGWVGVRAQEAMTERLGLTVCVDNDANLGALAEWIWGSARGCADVAYLKASTGIGAGLIVDGRPFRGAGGTAGEIGHTIIDPDGPVCRCGNRGCLETRVGTGALVELLRPTLGDVTIADVIARALEGDAGCRRVLHDAGRTIGDAVAHLCNLLNPARIVVGGDLAPAGEIVLGPLRDAVARAAIPSAAEDAEVMAGTLGERAEVLGAIALALRESGRGFSSGPSARAAA